MSVIYVQLPWAESPVQLFVNEKIREIIKENLFSHFKILCEQDDKKLIVLINVFA